jgi:hypothetical protein
MNARQTAQLEIVEELLENGEVRVRNLSQDGYSSDTARRVLHDLKDEDWVLRENEQAETWYIGNAGIEMLARNGYDYPPEWGHRIEGIKNDNAARDYYKEHGYNPGESVLADRYKD